MKLTKEAIDKIQYTLENGVHITPAASDLPKSLYLMKRFGGLWMNSAKIYLPVHLIVLLLRLRKGKEKWWKLVLRCIKEFIGSNTFGACFAMSIPGAYCYISDIVPHAKSTLIGNIISFTFSWAILFESNSRWSEMSLYVLAQWFEGFTYSLYKRKLVPVVPHWEKYVFGLAMGIMSWSYFSRNESDEKGRENKLELIFKFIFGDHNIHSLK